MVAMLRRHRDFRYLTLGTIGTQAGQWILNVTLGWLMLELTDSAFFVGLVGFAGGVPMILTAIPAGMLLDRYDRRSVLLLCQIALAILGVGLTLLVIADIISPAHLLAGAFLNGAFMSINNAARQTIVPSTVPRSDLATAIGLTSAAQHVSRIVGPSISGVIIGLSGVAGAFVFQAAVLIIAVACSLALSAAVAGSGAPGGRAGVLAGFHYLRDHPLVRDLILIAGIPMLFVFPYLQLLPVFARDILDIGPDGLGFLLAMSGIGAVSGGLLTPAAAVRIRRVGLFVLLATIGYSGIVIGFAFSKWAILSALLILLGSMTGSVYQSLNNTIIHLQIDDDVRGRVMGVYMLTFGLYPLGGLPLGVLAEVIGAPLAVTAGALLSSACAAILLLRSSALRQLTNQHRELPERA